jgi:hypothetical protein
MMRNLTENFAALTAISILKRFLVENPVVKAMDKIHKDVHK